MEEKAIDSYGGGKDTYQGPFWVASAFVTPCEFPTVAPDVSAGLFCTWLIELVACVGAFVDAGWLAALVDCSAVAPALQNPWYQL